MSASGSSWNVVSDRNRKDAFEALDPEAVLQRTAQLPLSTYRYIDGEEGVRHLGPMAQDWQRLVAGPLGLNADSTVINQGDFDAVNLAGVIALEARTSEQAAQIEAQAAEIAALRDEVAGLRQTLAAERSGADGLRETVAAQTRRLDTLDARLGVVLAALGETAPEAAPLASHSD